MFSRDEMKLVTKPISVKSLREKIANRRMLTKLV